VDTPFTVPDLLRLTVQRCPDKVALYQGKNTLTYKDLDTLSNAVAMRLLAGGLVKGDRVVILLRKSIEMVVAIWGVAKAGGVFVIVDTKLTLKQVAYRLHHCAPKVVIGDKHSRRLLGETHELTYLDAGDFATLDTANGKVPPSAAPIGKDVVAILYTSGSTGLPKGVTLSHENLVTGARIVARYLDIVHEDVVLSILPFHFDYGLNQLLTTIMVGAEIVLQNSTHPGDICRNLKSHDVTGLAGVPTLWVQLLSKLSPFATMDFPKLRYITNSGGSVPERHVTELQRLLPATSIYLMYGLTEAFRSTFLPPDELPSRPTSMGKAIPNVEILVVDEKGQECRAGEVGELVHRGGVIFQGYWNDVEATNRVLKPSPRQLDAVVCPELAVWSGDLVKRDDDGFLYFVGRRDKLIKSAGNRISPQEVEAALMKVQGINEAVVFGVPHEELGQSITAVVAVDQGFTLDQGTVETALQAEIARYMIPHKFVALTVLPRGSTGKVDRARIEKEFGSDKN